MGSSVSIVNLCVSVWYWTIGTKMITEIFGNGIYMTIYMLRQVKKEKIILHLFQFCTYSVLYNTTLAT